MRSLWWHSWTLSALAAAPVLDVIRRDPAFLLANEFALPQLLLLLVALLVVAPLPLVLAASRLRSSTSRWPALVLAPSAFAGGLYLGGQLGIKMGRLLPAAALALLVCWTYSRYEGVRGYLGWLALVALVAPLQVLLDPDVRGVTSPAQLAVTAGHQNGLRPPIVMLLLDELPTSTLLDVSGAIDRRRFPNLASLADQAHWFDDLWSVDPTTERAVPALLSGRELSPDALPITRDVPDNLFTLLAPRYRISAAESVTRLCPRDLNLFAAEDRFLGDSSWLVDVGVVALHLWTPQPLAGSLLPPIERDWQRFPTRPRGETRSERGSLWNRLRRAAPATRRPDRVTRFRRSLAAMEARTSSALYFSHLMLPHRPWIFMPDGEGYLADGFREMKDFGRDRWPDQQAVSNRAYQRHLLQAEFTDRLVGELLDRLRALDLFDRAAIVVTADHGISFRPGEGVRRLTSTNREDLLRVPLLLKLPDQQRPEVHPERRSSLDLLPTLLDLAAIASPPDLGGRSLLRPSAPVAIPTEPAAGLAYRDSVFDQLDSAEDLFRFGAFADWVGRRELEEQLQWHSEATVSLLGGGAHVAREAGSPTIPAWVFGWIESTSNLGGFGVAVAVDGAVAATGECQRVEGRNRFNVMLPPWALPVGEHQLEVVLIDPVSRRGWRLPAT